jgi:hypothetical protein
MVVLVAMAVPLTAKQIQECTLLMHEEEALLLFFVLSLLFDIALCVTKRMME